MKKQVIVLAIVLVMLFGLIGFVDWRDAHVVGGSVVDSVSGFLVGVFIILVAGVLILIVVERGIELF